MLSTMRSVAEFELNYPMSTEDINLITVMLDEGYLHSERLCEVCGRPMVMRYKLSGFPNGFRCRKNSKDCSNRTLKADSFFARNLLEVRKEFHVVLYWCENVSVRTMALSLKVTEGTIRSRITQLRDKCTSMIQSYPKIGYRNGVVDALLRIKEVVGQENGKSVTKDVVIMTLDGPNPGDLRMMNLADNNPTNVLKTIQEHVEEGTTIRTGSYDFKHRMRPLLEMTSFPFVYDTDHRQIDTVWAAYADLHDTRSGTRQEQLHGQIVEFVVRRNSGDSFSADVLRSLQVA